MNRQKWTVLAVVLALVGGSALLLNWLKGRQRLGAPGIKAVAQTGKTVVQIDLPPVVLDYQSEVVPPFPDEHRMLPQDTSFGRRIYTSRDGARVQLSVVLMGADRTSIHQPQFCLTGQGWALEPFENAKVAMEKPSRYELPVTRIVASKDYLINGQKVTRRGVYVYWFVADKAVTASPGERMLWMSRQLLRTGVLQRWAYVSVFTDCPPGGEKAAYQRVEQFIQASVPEFQLATALDRPGQMAALQETR